MKILGLSAHYHDSAAALVVDGVPVFAVQEERLSRKKNDAAFPLNAIEWCLDQAKLEPGDLDAVVFYEKPMLKFDRILTSALRAFPRSWSSFPKAMKSSLGEKLWIKGIISSHLGISGKKILFTEHHQAHAAAAFLAQPARRAAILTADGVGEWATLSVGTGEKRDDGSTSIKLLRELHFPHSLGMLYSTFTAFLGFEVNEGEYKVMGLASYGKPELVDAVRKVIRPAPGGAFTLDLDYFDFHTTAKRSYSSKLIDLFGPPRAPHEPLDPTTPEGRRFANIAASVQRVLEDTLVEITKSLQRETGESVLCFGGGVALNGVANGRILRESGFAQMYVPPSPGDAGCALGAALWADRIHFGNPDKDVPDHPYWGPEVDPEELARVATEDGLPLEATSDESAVIDRTVELLASDKIVGWMHGGAEFGPRALGNRSILTKANRIVIDDPSAANDRLELAIAAAKEKRRVIFFCSCRWPKTEDRIECHRVKVADLVLEAASAKGISIEVVEWPGGTRKPLEIQLSMPVFRKVCAGARSIPLPETINPVVLEGPAWATLAQLCCDQDSTLRLVGPAKWVKDRWTLEYIGWDDDWTKVEYEERAKKLLVSEGWDARSSV